MSKPDKLLVIANGSSNGIDTSFFAAESIDETKNSIRETLNISKDAFVFVFVGRVVRDKGINELVKAFKRLIQNYQNCVLLIVGPFESELDPVLPETGEFINKSTFVKFVGFQKDVRPYLKASDVLAFPSYREGFPNVVMQAGAMGLPSIVTDINGCNEIIIEGRNGVIIPPHDENALYGAMAQFVEHPDAVKELAANAREMIASRYEQKIIWQALLAEYQKQLQGV